MLLCGNIGCWKLLLPQTPLTVWFPCQIQIMLTSVPSASLFACIQVLLSCKVMEVMSLTGEPLIACAAFESVVLSIDMLSHTSMYPARHALKLLTVDVKTDRLVIMSYSAPARHGGGDCAAVRSGGTDTLSIRPHLECAKSFSCVTQRTEYVSNGVGTS